MHYVRVGTYRNEFADIKNGKSHVRITPHGGKSGLPHEIKFEENPRVFRVMWPGVVFCKFCGTAHQLRIDCDEKKAVNNNHPPNGEDTLPITTSRKDEVNRVVSESEEPNGHIPGSMDQPNQTLTHTSSDTQEDILKSNVITRTMGSGYPEVIGGESRIEPSSIDSANSSTHNKGTKTDQVAPQIMRPDQDNGPETAVPESWEELQNEIPSVTGPVSSKPLEKITRVSGSNRHNAASFVSDNNAETTPGCNDALEPPNRDDLPKLNDGYVSSPISKGNERLEATATVLATKLSSRTADNGPP